MKLEYFVILLTLFS